MNNNFKSSSEHSIPDKACHSTEFRNKSRLGSSDENNINKSIKKSFLNTDSLDDAMQELLDICRTYNDKSFEKSNYEKGSFREKSNKVSDSNLTDKIYKRGLTSSNKNRNNCDISCTQNSKSSTMTSNNCQNAWSPDPGDYNSIEKLQQKQTELQSQLDEVMQVAKNLAMKQKRKLKCILEDETAENSSIDDTRDDEDELIEFQQIENELRISEINRQLDNIQEELRVRLYRRLLSNTNQGTKSSQQKLTANRRGSQTDESSPSSSSCSEEPTMSTTSSIELGISVPVQTIVSCPKKDKTDNANNDSMTSHRDGKIFHQTDHFTTCPSNQTTPTESQSLISNQCSKGQYDQVKNPSLLNKATDYNELYNTTLSTTSSNTSSLTCQSSHFNSLTSRDLERIEEDEEDCLDQYNNSEHYRAVYEEKLSPIYSGIKLDKANDAYRMEAHQAYGTTSMQHQVGLGRQDVNRKQNILNETGSFSSASTDCKIHRATVNDGVKKTSRPLTLYLPKPDEEIDLLEHIQALGHDLNIISNDLKIDSSSARGYLWKCCSKNKKWLKRYFCFDRNAKALSYYENESHLVKKQQSPKNSVSFDEISDVYVDHKLSGIGLRDRTPKKRNYVFVLATLGRKYLLASSRAEAMRAWIDVLFTAANTTEYIEEYDAITGVNGDDATAVCMNDDRV